LLSSPSQRTCKLLLPSFCLGKQCHALTQLLWCFLLTHMFFKATKFWSFSGLKSQAPFAFVCTWFCSYSSLFCVWPCSYSLLFICVGSKSQGGENLTHGWIWHALECIELIIFFRGTRACLNLTFLVLFGLLTCFSGSEVLWSSGGLSLLVFVCVRSCSYLLWFLGVQ